MAFFKIFVTFFLGILLSGSQSLEFPNVSEINFTKDQVNLISDTFGQIVIEVVLDKLPTLGRTGPRRIPLLPHFPGQICRNASDAGFDVVYIDNTLFTIRLISNMLSDIRINGLDQLYDDFNFAFVDGGELITMKWKIDVPTLQVIGDLHAEAIVNSKTSIIPDMLTMLESRDTNFHLTGGFVEFASTVKIYPVDEPLGFKEFDFNFGINNLDWSGNSTMKYNVAENNYTLFENQMVDIGLLVKLYMDSIWSHVEAPVEALVLCGLDYAVNECSLADIILNDLSCLRLNIGEIMARCSQVKEMSNMTSLKLSGFLNNWETLAFNECGTQEHVSTTTEKYPATSTTETYTTYSPPVTTALPPDSDAIKLLLSQTQVLLDQAQLLIRLTQDLVK